MRIAPAGIEYYLPCSTSDSRLCSITCRRESCWSTPPIAVTRWTAMERDRRNATSNDATTTNVRCSPRRKSFLQPEEVLTRMGRATRSSRCHRQDRARSAGRARGEFPIAAAAAPCAWDCMRDEPAAALQSFSGISRARIARRRIGGSTRDTVGSAARAGYRGTVFDDWRAVRRRRHAPVGSDASRRPRARCCSTPLLWRSSPRNRSSVRAPSRRAGAAAPNATRRPCSGSSLICAGSARRPRGLRRRALPGPGTMEIAGGSAASSWCSNTPTATSCMCRFMRLTA